MSTTYQTYQSRNWTLYVLRLQDNKYYVGITTKTPQIRMQEHLSGIRVAYWTAKHKPLEIILEEDLGRVSKAHAEKYENKVTRDLMKKHGINNVRGGDLTSVEDYIKRFGYIWDKDGWHLITVMTMLIAVIILLLFDKLFF